jgi:preprotein translocase subunit SecA
MSALQNFAKKVFGTQNERELKSIYPIVAKINSLEPEIKKLSDAELRAKTDEFKARYAKGETLDQLLPEAFAVVREAAWRVRKERHYDVQLIGGVTLHRGRIAEMRTGEGKTLVATLPCYLNALAGKGVHVITVNDYLARRDAATMGKVHEFLGLTTGVIVHGLTDAQRKQNYACDITYGTNNEFGFDYLRDNMKFRLEDYVQRELNFAIVDEVDSILIDEARTPLIISGPTDDTTDLYYKIDRTLLQDGGLTKDVDYTIDEKSKTAALTEAGVDKMEARLGIANLYDPANIEVLHHVNQGLRAQMLFKRDVDYVVKDGEVMIVDEFTGRLMPGRRWSDGLHQAIEAKEGVDIENENQTLATITFQNFFRMYGKLGGMTGTADTEAHEFKQIYKLDVTVIPTNRSMIRKDHADVIFKSAQGKYKEIAEEIKRLQQKGQPVLVGTVSVEKSEIISRLLKAEGIKHSVLNAKQHEREADIVAQAGRKGSVTIATNMAGRGTDILLGGNAETLAKVEAGPAPSRRDFPGGAEGEEPYAKAVAEHQAKHDEAFARLKETCAKEREEVRAAGGLFILGTERHESRRIDNQLRGRAGRQGDPGESRFYLSLDDDLMRIFGSVNIGRFMEDDLPIEHRWITKAIENAQKKVEGHNYDIRKHLLEYDDVMNQQRKVVYAWRREVLSVPNLRNMAFSMIEELATAIAEDFFPGGKIRKHQGQAHLDVKELNDAVRTTLMIPTQIQERDISPFNNVGLRKLIVELADKFYKQKEQSMGEETMRQLEKMILLTTIDHLWKDHLLAMDHLRDGVGLQGYGQKDPLIEYKKQGFKFFELMMNQITGDSARKLFAVQLAPQEDIHALEEEAFGDPLRNAVESHPDAQNLASRTPPQGAFPLGRGPTPMHPGSVGGAGPAHGPGSRPGAGGMQYAIGPDGSLVPAPTPSPEAAQRQAQDFSDLMRGPSRMTLNRGPVGGGAPTPAANDVSKVGRNDLCPCGSGKKYKKCHGT